MDDILIILSDKDGNIISDKNEYTDYSFPSSYTSVTAPFSVTFVNVDFEVKASDLIEFRINGVSEYFGIIERPEKGTGKNSAKNSATLTVSGRDRTLILVEGFCNNFKDFNNKTPKYIIENLINQTNFYTKPKNESEDVTDDTGFNSESDLSDRNSAVLEDVNNSETQSQRNDITVFDAEFTKLKTHKNYKITIGNRVFDKINQLIKMYGFEILYISDGTLYIGDLNKKRYNDPISYSIVFRKIGVGNVLDSRFVDDISGRFSTIQVTAQTESFFGEDTNITKIAKDSTLPAVKFMAVQSSGNADTVEKTAISIREDQRIAGFSLSYTVDEHTADNGETWNINRYVNVFDDVNNVSETLVLYGRTFTFSSEGRKTLLNISKERLNELEI